MRRVIIRYQRYSVIFAIAMEEWNYEEDKIPMDGDEDADCCHLFNCFWVRNFKDGI